MEIRGKFIKLIKLQYEADSEQYSILKKRTEKRSSVGKEWLVIDGNLFVIPAREAAVLDEDQFEMGTGSKLYE